jgi:hypothetical protein
VALVAFFPSLGINIPLDDSYINFYSGKQILDYSVFFLYNKTHMQTDRRHIFVLCIKSVPVLFFARFGLCSLSLFFFYETLPPRQSHDSSIYFKRNRAKKNAIKERVARELRIPNWRSDGYG